MAARDAVLVPARVEESLLATGEAQQANSMDEATFRLLYDKLAHPIAAYVRRITGDRSLSEDILQGGPILGTDIERAFHRLKPQERALLWLAYVEGCEHFEIAQILGLKERSVRVLLFRARKKLTRTVKKMGLVCEVTS